MKVLLVIFTVAVSCILSVAGLRCYACSVSLPDDQPDPTNPCIIAPQNVSNGVSSCPPRMKFCTIMRNDFKDSGQVSSLVRGCSETPPVLNDDIEGPTFVTYFRSCTETDLCNSGDGRQSISGGNGNGQGNQGGILVPGIKDGASSIMAFPLLLILSVLLYNCLT